MTFLDYFVIIILVMSIASSAANGLIRSSLTLIATVAGFLLAARFYSFAAKPFHLATDNVYLSNFFGFALIFVLVVIAGSVISHLLRRTLQRSGVTWIDKILGAGFGFVRGWLIASAIYLALLAFPISTDSVKHALFAPYLAYGAQAITYAASDEMREKFFQTYDELKVAWSKKGADIESGLGRTSH